MELIVKIRKKLRSFELNVDFSVKDEVFALLGASGCGKSMTLNCIAGIETPDSGFISLNGRVLFDSEKKINLSPQQRKAGYLFQNYALFPNMTIEENIAFVVKGNKAEKIQKAQENIKRFALDGLEKAYPRQLSGGQQQRAAFARIVAADSEVLLLDEPFSALDSYLKWQLELEFSDILRDCGGAVLVSHDRGEAYRLADRIGVMKDGRLEIVSSKHELFANPQTMSATVLTGCKNISQAYYIDEHTLFAEDWQLTLKSSSLVPQNLKYVGIRAHYLQAKKLENDNENTFTMKVVQVIEDTFSYIVMVQRHDTDNNAGLLRWEVDKGAWQGQSVINLCLPADKLILLDK